MEDETNPLDWPYHLAAAAVTHTALSKTAENGLRAAFASVKELRLVLANGALSDKKAEALDVFILISNGEVTSEPLTSCRELAPGTPSLAARAMQTNSIITAVAGTPENEEDLANCVDWLDMQDVEMTWALASPLTCKDPHCTRLFGAALVAGEGDTGPSINPDWFREWGCELAHNIAHASISVMESSLDMLRLLFPPKIVESLVYNIASSHADELEGDASTAATRLTNGSFYPSTLPSPWPPYTAPPASNGESSEPLRARGGRYSASPPPERISTSSGDRSSTESDLRHHSPFALIASHAPQFSPPPTAMSGRSMSWGSDHSGPAVRRSPSHAASSSHLAAAVLRQVSLQSTPSLLLSDHHTGSPEGSELEGYEDLLEDDAKSHAARRPSQCLDRATSQSGPAPPSPGEPFPPSASAPESVPAPDSELAAAAAAAAAAAVGQTLHTASSTVTSWAAVSDATSSDVAVLHELYTAGHNRENPPQPQHTHKHNSRYMSPHTLSTISEGTSSNPSGSVSEFNSGSLPGSLPSPLRSLHDRSSTTTSSGGLWDQEWDLAFVDHKIERAYSRHMAPQFAVYDRAMGSALLGIMAAWILNAMPAVAVLGVVLASTMLLPGTLALVWPLRWDDWRTPLLSAVRMLVAGLSGLVFHSPAKLLMAVGVGLLATAFPLPLRFHIPLQLFCVWAALNANLSSFILAFVAPTALLCAVEHRMRRRYMRERT